MRKGERPVIIGDGREVHDYIHVTDVAAGCLAAMASDSHGHVLNLVTGVDSTLTQVVQAVLDICDHGLSRNTGRTRAPCARPAARISASAGCGRKR
ncbi:NAD-dependent epimerase/dehydratase family protein [Siccirubricoccus deserti]